MVKVQNVRPGRKRVNQKGYLSTGDVAQACAVAPRTVARWFDEGLLKGFVVPAGGERRIDAGSVRQLMASYGIPLSWGNGILHYGVLLIGVADNLVESVCSAKLPMANVKVVDDWFAAGQAASEEQPTVAVLDSCLDGFAWHTRHKELAPRVIALTPEDFTGDYLGITLLKKPVAPHILVTHVAAQLRQAMNHYPQERKEPVL